MPLPSFTVTGNVFDILGNVAGGELVENGFGAGTPVTVTFIPNVPINVFVTWSGHLERVPPVPATINSDGTITRNGSPVQLLANDPGLSITGLQWTVAIGSMARLIFDAPLDGTTLDLITAVPVPAIPITILPSLPVSGLIDATPFTKGFLTSVHDAGEARSLIGVSLVALDDIVWYANSAAFPGSGVVDEVYGARDTGKLYLWTGSSYVAARASVTSADITDSTATGRSLVTAADGAAARAAVGDPLFIDVAAAPYSVTPSTTNPEVLIQQAINYAAANGIPEVIVSKPGTYTVDLHTIPAQSFYAAAIYAVSNVKLTLKPGVVIKLKNSAALPGGATSGQIIGGDTTLKTGWTVEGGTVDGNAANQSSLAVDSGVSLNRCRSSYVRNVVVKNLYGTASAPPGETLHFEATKCRDVHFIGCEADGSGSANTATGFSTNHSFGVAWTDCVAHEMGFGMGFTNWMSSGLRYTNCHAYLCGAFGFNAERSEGITYSSCIAGSRSPFIEGTTENPYFPSGQTALGNNKGFAIHGCTDVEVAGCVATYNDVNLHVYTSTSSGLSDRVNTRVHVTGDFRHGTTANVTVEAVTNGGVDQVDVAVLNSFGGNDGDVGYIFNSVKDPIVQYKNLGTSGVRWLSTTNGGAYAFRWLAGGFTGPLAGLAHLGLTSGGQLATTGRQLFRTPTATSYTIVLTDEVVAVTDTTAARTITLPSAATAGAGATYTIKDESGGAATHNITIARAGSDLIDGATSKVISANYGWVRVMSTGTGWDVIADFSFTISTKVVVPLTTTATLPTVAGREYIYLLGTGAVPTLPTAVGNVSYYVLKNVTPGTITVATTSAQFIESSTTYVLAAGESITVVSDNANWKII